MSPGGGVAQVLQALASADCNRMSRELPCSAAHGPGLVRLCTRHCGGNEHREKKFCTHARFGPVSVWWTPASTRWCLASVCVSSRGLFASGLFSFCSSIACRNAARCEMTVAGIRYARRFYTGHIHMEYASLSVFFLLILNALSIRFCQIRRSILPRSWAPHPFGRPDFINFRYYFRVRRS